MSDLNVVFEQFEYAIDVVRQYSSEIKNEKNKIDSVYTLGKIAAAMEELEIHYQCLSDIVFEEANETKSDLIKVGDTIPSVGAGDFINFSINDDVLDFTKGHTINFNTDENNATE